MAQETSIDFDKGASDEGAIVAEAEGSTTTTSAEETEASSSAKTVPYAALREERAKRQERDRQIQAMQTQLASYERLAAQYAAGVPQAEDFGDDVYSDIPGAMKKMQEKILTHFETERRRERYETSEEDARDAYEDYDDVIAHFESMARQNPALVTQMERSKRPAIYAYKTAKKDMSKGDEVQQRINEAIEREKAKLAAQYAPRSISSARGGGLSSTASYEKPSLKDILGR